MAEIDNKNSYNENSFWKKIKKYGKKAGGKVIYTCLLLFYTTRKKETPTHVKATIYGALGYFISMIDVIPDITPFVGYSDDLMVILSALAIASSHIDDEVREKANERFKKVFGVDYKEPKKAKEET